MKETGLIFKQEMVQAIREGRKSVTRLIIKLKDGSKPEDEDISWLYEDESDLSKRSVDKIMDFTKTYPYWTECKCPYEPGDLIYVKETWLSDDPLVGYPAYHYKANGYTTNEIIEGWKGKWKSPLFMPKAAARIWLEIEDIKVERLQDISEEDCKAEGVIPYDFFVGSDKEYFQKFQELWQSINGEESWQSNPFVWVIKFNKTTKP